LHTDANILTTISSDVVKCMCSHVLACSFAILVELFDSGVNANCIFAIHDFLWRSHSI